MARTARITVSYDVFDGVAHWGDTINADLSVASLCGKRETVTLTAGAFNALSPPAGAQAAIIKTNSSNISVTLKGVTGDTGNLNTPSSGVIPIPFLIPLTTSVSIGLRNGGGSDQTVEVVWL